MTDAQPAGAPRESGPESPGNVSKSSPPVPLSRNRSFLGMTITQFLGAFNDNVFKQLLLLIALDYKALKGLEEDPYQSTAQFLFALPFVLFSGFAGYLSDKLPKRGMIVFCKVLEILVMIAAVIAFSSGKIGDDGLMTALLMVLFFMGLQSALFGPSKYGILPEMLPERQLPSANGIIQMTTFLAIIFGMALSGLLKDVLSDRLWLISTVCVGIAVFGTLTSLLIAKTPTANPKMKFSVDCLLVERSAARLIIADRMLMATLLVYTVFWFAGAVMLLLTNLVAKDQLELGDTWTSISQAFLGVGIAIGCVVCGRVSQGHIRFDLVRRGGMGLAVVTLVTALLCVYPFGSKLAVFIVFSCCMLITGFFAGIFAVPPQVFIQARPPAAAKGRVLGAMGLITWIGILIATGAYLLLTSTAASLDIPPSWGYLAIGALFIVTALVFRVKNPEHAQDPIEVME